MILFLNKLGRRLIWLICALHTNELPLKHLMAELDGKTTSNNAFSGPVGKIVDKVTNYRVRDSIPKLKWVIWSDYSNEILYYFHYLGLGAPKFDPIFNFI